MDSITQIVLGAAVGEAVLGKKVGNKAMLYGAIAGTIPDLDVFASYFTNTVTALSIHRGFTHSIVFSVLFAPLLGWMVSRYETYKNLKDWTWLFFWAFVTHPILDAHTTWGTQLFWPLDTRLAFKTIFVVDPLYTLPFLVCLILAFRQKRTAYKRSFYNKAGLIISTSYLAITFGLKAIAYQNFEAALKNNNINYLQIDTRPTPLNTILWSANIETKKAYLLANYSFFDSKPITFTRHLKNHELLGDLAHHKTIKQMITIADGWYTISKKDGKLFFNDLRFGLLSIHPSSDRFVFQYQINTDATGNVTLVEVPKNNRDGKKLLSELWLRIKGN